MKFFMTRGLSFWFVRIEGIGIRLGPTPLGRSVVLIPGFLGSPTKMAARNPERAH